MYTLSASASLTGWFKMFDPRHAAGCPTSLEPSATVLLSSSEDRDLDAGTGYGTASGEM
jgi:hypothetical protein